MPLRLRSIWAFCRSGKIVSNTPIVRDAVDAVAVMAACATTPTDGG